MISRSAVFVAGVLLLGAACTGAPPATPSPQPTPTLQPPFTPAPPPSATPTAPPPTPAPTPSPTPEITPPATASPSPEPSPTTGTGSHVEVFSDDMSDRLSGWGTGQTAGGTASYLDQTLDLTPASPPAYLWSRRQVEGSWSAMRLTGTLLPAPESQGYLGLMCGGADDHLVGAVLSTQGAWVFARIRGGAVEVIAQDAQAGIDVGIAEPILMTLDCVVQDGGVVGLVLHINGQEETAGDVPDGPQALDRVAAYAEGAEGPFTARFDDVSLIASVAPDGLPPLLSAGAVELLQHVPEDYRVGCFEAVPSAAEAGALVALACALPAGSDVDLAEYVQFDSSETMNAAYQQRVDTYGSGEDQSCQEGPAEGLYTIGGEDTGRLLCAEQLIGARFDWTDERLDILSNLTDFDADYAVLYEEWLQAGPNP